MSKLSPVASLVKNQGINVNPVSMKGLLKYAKNKDTTKKDDSSDSDDNGDLASLEVKKHNKRLRSKGKRNWNSYRKMEKIILMKIMPFVYLIESVRVFRLIQEQEQLNKEMIEM